MKFFSLFFSWCLGCRKTKYYSWKCVDDRTTSLKFLPIEQQRQNIIHDDPWDQLKFILI